MGRMKRLGIFSLVVASGAWACAAAAQPGAGKAASQAAKPPNIIFLMADDLGYGDLGCYGQKKIRTPNLDRMAAGGMRFTQHYAGNAVCAPSRCVLMTGKHPGHAWIRNNKEVKPEGQEPMRGWEVTVAELLHAKGYATGAFGKWGLGMFGSEGSPLRQGFDRFFGYNCQRHAHNYYTTYLWDNDRRIYLNNPPFSPYQRFPKGLDPHNPKNYERYRGKVYAPDLICEAALRFIRENKDRPFFLYFPTTVPHLPLQVPEDSLKEYLGKWPDPPYLGDRAYLPHYAPRAAYAAMITRMDRDIGRMVRLVKELGLEKDTIWVFTSDNGPLYSKLGGTDTEFFNSAGGLRGRKGSLYEGGVRVPCIVRWPGRVPEGAVNDRITGFEDWLPTLLDLIGAGDVKPKDIDGVSFAPVLLGGRQPPRPFLYREFAGYSGWQSVRIGKWKGVRQGLNPRGKKAKADLHIELYDLAKDPAETEDVSVQNPEIVRRIEMIMNREHARSALFPLRGLDLVR